MSKLCVPDNKSGIGPDFVKMSCPVSGRTFYNVRPDNIFMVLWSVVYGILRSVVKACFVFRNGHWSILKTALHILQLRIMSGSAGFRLQSVLSDCLAGRKFSCPVHLYLTSYISKFVLSSKYSLAI